MTGTLSEDQVAFFRREGYLSPLRAVDEAQAADFCRRIEDYEASSGSEVNERLKIKAHLAFPWMVELARNPAIVSAVQSLIGPDVLLFGASAFAKGAKDSRFVSWHQDSAYYGLDPHEEVTVWVAFTPSTSESGCLRVIPRSHLGPDLAHKETYDSNNLLSRGQTVQVDETDAVEMPLRPGEFSMHHERTVHGSLANRAPHRRIGLAFFYMPAHTRSTLKRRSALLVAGEDRYGHWDRDPEPRFDLDPESMSYLDAMWSRYKDVSATPQAGAPA